jgi:serine/threonine-protein kinase
MNGFQNGDGDGRDAPLPLGALLDGSYRLIRLLSEGGMGNVYEAVQIKLGRQVAVKVMAEGLEENPEALARFRRELDISAKLTHPHIVQLLDFGTTASGQPYLVTEYVEGEDLEQRLDRVGRLPLPETLSIIGQVVSALAAVHARAIVHRDLKPANVLLLPIDGAADFVKLLDFGISKITTSSTQLTRPATMLGTPGYMSPEQASGRAREVDHRSDQWALAAMTWHMLTGRPPFDAVKLDELVRQVVSDDPPSLLAAAPELPRALEPVLRRGLAKKPTKRFPTVTAFLRALESAAGK